MGATAYIDNIRERLIDEMSGACAEITVALSTYANAALQDVLCEKGSKGVNVRILIDDDQVRAFRRRCDTISDQAAFGGENVEVAALSGAAFARDVPYPFAIVDRQKVLVVFAGKELSAKEEPSFLIAITSNNEIIGQYLQRYYAILTSHGHRVEPLVRADFLRIHRRLDVIKSLLLLGEQIEISRHIEKLRPYRSDAALADILALVLDGHFYDAITQIDRFSVDERVANFLRYPPPDCLRLERRTLSVALNALINERLEIERKIQDFDRQYHQTLGAALVEYLGLRRNELSSRRDQGAGGEDGYRAASDDYEAYRQGYEAMQQEPARPPLSADQRQTIRNCFRLASWLCCSEEMPDQSQPVAQEVTERLRNAYKSNNIDEVRSILDRLVSTPLFSEAEADSRDSERLTIDVRRLRQRINDELSAIMSLLRSDIHMTLLSSENWIQKFEDQRLMLMQEINRLKEKGEDERRGDSSFD